MAEKGIGSFEAYRALTLSAVDAFNARDYENARTKFIELARTNPANIAAHEILCALHLKFKDLPAAEKEYAIILKLAAEQHIPISKPRTFAELVAEAGDEKKLESSYREQVESGTPDPIVSVKTAMRLSHLYMADNRFAEAEAILLKLKDRLLDGARR